MLTQTPNQTVGPFFQGALVSGGENILAGERARGQRIILSGRLLDGDGLPVADGLVEIWQADARGHFNHPADPNQALADQDFRGFGRADTRDGGAFRFKTVKPGRVPGADGRLQAPHVNLRVFARGMLLHALTRLYFADEPSNAADALLNAIPEPERRRTLVAALVESEDLPTYRLDIRLQGEGETVFFVP